MTRRRIRVTVITAVVAIIIAAVGYYGYTRLLGNQSAASDLTQFGIDATQEVQIISVRRGNLSNAVSINGSLRYATRETIGIPFSGKVKEVKVEVGDRVQAGDVLLTMDEAALIEANKAYREADVNLQNAQKALDELLQPPAETVDDANFKIKNAQHALATAEEALDDALDPDGTAQKKARKDVETALDAVDDAADAIKTAEDAIKTAEDAIKTAEDAVEDAQQAIPDAQNGITNAQLALRTAEKAITDHDTAITQTDINKAQEALNRANRDLELARDARTDTLAKVDASIRTATRAYTDAYDEYNAVWLRWLGIDLKDHEVAAPETLLTKLNIHLESLFGRVAKQLATDVPTEEIDRPLPKDDPDTPYNEQLVAVWLRFNAPAVIVDCGPYPPTTSRLCIQKEFDDAWDKLLPLKEALDTAETEAARTREDADRSITDAEQAIETAQKSLNDLMPSAERDQERADLVTRRDLAQEDVKKAERQLTDAHDQVTDARDQVQKARDAVETARENLTKAEDNHADALKDLAEAETEERRVADPNTSEKKTMRLDIEAKELDLAKARKELSDLQSPTLAEIELKRAELAIAQRAFDDAEIPDAQGELVATLSGIVGEVHVKDNEDVAEDQDAVVIADPASVEMRGSVDEVDVLFLQVGDQAEVETDALAGQTIVGTITDIAAFGSTTSGTVFGADFEQDVGSVSYPVTIGIQAPPGTTLPEGLSARGQVVIRDIQNVLLVPVGAIFGTQQEPQLLVQTSTDPVTYELKPVVLGVSDDFWTELISGVNEGDDILMTVVGGSQSPDFGF